MRDTLVTRFLGGSPLTVVLRLGGVSLIVGALMAWIGIDAMDLLDDLQRAFAHLYGTGFAAVRDLGRTLVAGAAVVIPVWLVLRLLSYRGPRPRRLDPDGAARAADPEAPVSRWSNPERVWTGRPR